MYTPNCDVFWVGSYPLRDPMVAGRRILRSKELLLHWPQLPKRSKKERMIDQTYAALLTKDGQFTKGAAPGWNAMWRLLKGRTKKEASRQAQFKTQLAGPISMFGKLGRSGSPRSEQLLHSVTLWLKHAYWQIDAIRDRGFRPIVVLDEPLLPTYMGPTGSSQARKTLKLLRSIVKRLKRRGALVGIHCCNRVSPVTLVELGVDLIHFDAYHFPTQLTRARSELQAFLRDGGIVAWGIVPTNETLTPASHVRLEKSLNDLLSSMESRGLPLRRVLSQSMVAPTCGTGLLSAEQSEKVMDFALNISRHLKQRHGL